MFISNKQTGRWVSYDTSGPTSTAIRWSPWPLTACEVTTVGIPYLKFTTSGTKDPLRSFTPRTTPLTTKVVCVTQFELLTKETKKQSNRTPGRKITILFIFLTTLLIRRLPSGFLDTPPCTRLFNLFISYLTFRTGQLFSIKAFLNTRQRKRKKTGQFYMWRAMTELTTRAACDALRRPLIQALCRVLVTKLHPVLATVRLSLLPIILVTCVLLWLWMVRTLPLPGNLLITPPKLLLPLSNPTVRKCAEHPRWTPLPMSTMCPILLTSCLSLGLRPTRTRWQKLCGRLTLLPRSLKLRLGIHLRR